MRAPSFKDRHIWGAGAAACAVCCAPPVLALIGVAGAAATVATFVFAGAVFGLVVAVGAALALWRRRTQRAASCTTTGPGTGPVDIQLTTTRSGT